MCKSNNVKVGENISVIEYIEYVISIDRWRYVMFFFFFCRCVCFQEEKDGARAMALASEEKREMFFSVCLSVCLSICLLLVSDGVLFIQLNITVMDID